MEKVTPEVAAAEVAAWLDNKKISEEKREANAESIKTFARAIVDGALTIDTESFKITHTLKFPFGEEKKVTAFTYKPRLRVKEVQAAMKGIANTDADGRMSGYVAAIADEPRGIIIGMDTEDYAISQAVAVFFL